MVKLKMSFGPTTRIFGVRPLNRDETPSWRSMFFKMENPDSGKPNGRLWIRVLITSSGAEAVIEDIAPPMEAAKF